MLIVAQFLGIYRVWGSRAKIDCLLIGVDRMSLKIGLKAVEEQRYQEAIELLTYFCQNCFDYHSQEYIQAKIGLARAHYGLGEREQVVYICQELARSESLSVRQWAQQWLNAIQATPKYTSEELKTILTRGRQALKKKNYPEAIKSLEEYCQHNHQPDLPETQQAKMWLVQAYAATRDTQGAISVCEELNWSGDTMIKQWAKEKLPSLRLAQQKHNQSKYSSDATYLEHQPQKSAKSDVDICAQPTIKTQFLPQRSTQPEVNLAQQVGNSGLFLATVVTLMLLLVPSCALCFFLVWLINYNWLGWSLMPVVGMAVAVTMIVNFVWFCLATPLIDRLHKKQYNLRRIPLTEISYYSPEAADLIERICRENNLKLPLLGVIDTPIPTAFSYGSFANQSRITVTKGLFTYLDEEEIATVYAHELAHILKGDARLMTFGYSFSYMVFNLLPRSFNLPEIVSSCMSYFLLYLSRVREYHADYFAVKTTGNPNALSRSLLKIAYGIIEEQEREGRNSNLLVATRGLGIYDPKMAIPAGIAYQINSKSENAGRIFAWEIFNPWATWLELNATHPLTGKRLQVLANYAKQLQLSSAFNLDTILEEGKKLNQHKLRGNFALDLIILNLPWLSLLLGLALGLIVYYLNQSHELLLSLPLWSLGLGIIIKGCLRYSEHKKVKETKVIGLISNPYTNPLRGWRVELSGELIGKSENYGLLSCQLKLQDEMSLIYLDRFPRWFNSQKLASGSLVKVTGWFRRGLSVWLDIKSLKTPNYHLQGYHRLGAIAAGVASIALGTLFFWLQL